MLRIGLTGGIGSGKSIVASYFSQLGISIIDTDIIAREIVQPGMPALKKIKQHFGLAVLNKAGELDRRKLRDLVFKSETDRHWLETLLHPLIRAMVSEKIAQADSPYCIVVIPLLVEKIPNPMIDRILVVDAGEQQQIERTRQRDQISEEQISAIMQTQATRAQRLAVAHDVIHNESDLENLKQQVRRLHEYYLLITNVS